jgi:hypothetical protein
MVVILMFEKTAIIDIKNQDVGLKVLIPEADYFILEEEFDRTRLNTKYNITPIIHNKHVNTYEYITNNKYDNLFVIATTYGCLIQNNEKSNYLSMLIDLINSNKFKNICFFDNSDYDYDPNIFFDTEFIKENSIKFFKRYYNKEKIYSTNVYPFPYITFGHRCNIENVSDLFYKNINMDEKICRIFFSGTPLVHIDTEYGVMRNRRDMLINIQSLLNIHNPGQLPHELFMNEMENSKYSLDLLGVGDPNTRTFEILCSGSLKIGQRSNLKWTFDDEFCEETIFDNANDLLEKIKNLENYPELYKKCIDKQNEIVRKYMNVDVLRNYIIKIIKTKN